MLVIYSDGVTEALNLAGEEFGDERLATELIKTRTAPLPDILQGGDHGRADLRRRRLAERRRDGAGGPLHGA